jgi:type I restriction enzyme M protein
MTDYLERIAAAKADIARLKGEKEAFEQSNALEDADEEELANWNYAKDLDRQMKELKAEHKDAFKELAKLEKAAAKGRATKKILPPLAGDDIKPGRNRSLRGALATKQSPGDKDCFASLAMTPQLNVLPLPLAGGSEGEGVYLQAVKAALQPVLNQLATLEAALAPYEQIKTDLAARVRYRELTSAFVNELKSRCGAMSDDQKRALVLELFAQDVQAGLDAAVTEKRQELVRLVEGLWDKYRITLTDLRHERAEVETRMENYLQQLAYTDSFVRD